MQETSAGGVVYVNLDGEIQIQLIQDRYGKITLAKGKREPGESIEQTALREIWEETGVHGQLVQLIEKVAYHYRTPAELTIDKEVYYYLVQATSSSLIPQIEEITQVAWYSPQDAWTLQLEQGYANNTHVLQSAFQLLGIEVV
jgi:8-oxo-dGTP pyrophosphatase MutT (NUDIX family)